MAYTHGVIHTTHCACWDVDSLNYSGVAEKDLDNGTFVTLGDLQKDENAISEYTFTVTEATDATGKFVYVVDSPVVGSTLEMQLTGDPRAFYNVQGRPMSVKQLVAGDEIEVIGLNFATGFAPADQTSYKGATIENGQLKMVDATVTSNNAIFTLLGSKTIAVGQELVPSYVLRYTA